MRSLLTIILLNIQTIFLITFAIPSKAEVTQVDVFYPELSQNHQLLHLTGTVEAIQDAELAPLQSGLVAKIFVDVGDRVTKGDVLLALDDTLIRLSLKEAVASVEAVNVLQVEAKRLYQEVLALSKQKVIAETVIGERRAALAMAKAELTKQQANLARQEEVLNRHTLYAPFTGIIAHRNADVGEWVNQQTSVFNLVEQQRLRLRVAIPQQYYGQLINQQDISTTVTPDFVNASPIKTKLNRWVAVSNNQSRTLIAYIDLPEDSQLVAGMSANAKVQLPNKKQVMMWLPKSAIKQHPDGSASIFAVVNNKAKRYMVDIINQQADSVAVTGVPENQAVVVSGVELLREGNDLKINSDTGKPI